MSSTHSLHHLICYAALVAIPGCGAATVTDHLNAVLDSHPLLHHTTVPSPSRQAELFPETTTRLPYLSVNETLRKHEHGAAILDVGEAAIPDLVRLLEDKRRRTLATVFLAEIGGETAARALLKYWRRLRGNRLVKNIYLHRNDPDGANPRTLPAGTRPEGVDGDFYSELLAALKFCGRPISAEIAADTAVAMDETEKLSADGRTLQAESRLPKTDGRPFGSTARWSIGVVDTATEGLAILAVIGAQEAPALFGRALRSPVYSLRFTAARNASYLGADVRTVIPALWKTLDEPRLRSTTLWALANILRDVATSTPSTDEEWRARIATLKTQLEERGYKTQ